MAKNYNFHKINNFGAKWNFLNNPRHIVMFVKRSQGSVICVINKQATKKKQPKAQLCTPEQEN